MTNFLHHRGYEGSVEYSAEDKMFHGRVMHIHDVISYGGDNLQQLETFFQEAVDDYLDFCDTRGKAPNTPSTDPASANLRQ